MENPTSQHLSTFLSRGVYAEATSLASIHLKRDLQVPVILQEKDEDNDGYDEGKVINTRFGSFPHSTLIGAPWGSQVRASAVDTGSRGRRDQSHGQKRKRETGTPDGERAHKEAIEASTGFAHILPPTPESWTLSLPHRTQVVYTPDYSYILQRLRARPGTVLIEAGAGSGSFTHAAIRSVYNGYPSTSNPSGTKIGQVYSYEFHEGRYDSVRDEIASHGLSDIVHTTHRDVCEEGFHVSPPTAPVKANAVFLDLPAPWLALPHLTRDIESTPLDPNTTVRICTFSPCIEQVQRTITSLRSHGWLEIEMVELAARRLEARRERVGLQEEGLRGVNSNPASVDEAIGKLRELVKRADIVQAQSIARSAEGGNEEDRAVRERLEREKAGLITKQERLRRIEEGLKERKIHLEGRLVHRIESEVKTHTSYLVFAVLPMAWGEEDEARARERMEEMVGNAEKGRHKSKRQQKREARAERIEKGEE